MITAQPFPPTPRQMDLLRFITGFTEAHGIAPTLQEMANGIGLANKGTAARLLDMLEQRGQIVRGYFVRRGTVVVDAPAIPRAPDGAPLRFIPVVQLGVHGNIHNGTIGQDHA